MAGSPAPIAQEDERIGAPADRVRPRRVALDGRNLQLSQGTGVATYGRCVVESLAQLGLLAELVLDSARLASDTAQRSPIARARRLVRALARTRATVSIPAGDPLRARFPWCAGLHAADDLFGIAQVHFDLFGRPLRVAGRAPDLMHWTYPLPVRFADAPNIYTIHDLIPLRHPAYTTTDVARFRRLLTAVAAQADHIVTVSEASRTDVIELLGCPADKVTNTYQALSLGDTPADAAAGAAALGLPLGGYLIYAGNIEPRKNVSGLIAGWLAGGAALPLVLVGPDGWLDDAALRGHSVRVIDAPASPPPGTGPVIVRARYLPYATLLGAIRGARAMVFPSFAEGFGLPILEAMTLGTPVVTSNLGAMAEVAGDAALLVDPRDVRDIGGAIARLATDAALAAELGARGVQRAALFSMDNHAARLGHVYDLVMRRRGPGRDRSP